MEAKKTKAGKAEATLKIVVLDKKTVKVAIRPVQVRDGRQLVSLGNAADPKKLLNRSCDAIRDQRMEADP